MENIFKILNVRVLIIASKEHTKLQKFSLSYRGSAEKLKSHLDFNQNESPDSLSNKDLNE